MGASGPHGVGRTLGGPSQRSCLAGASPNPSVPCSRHAELAPEEETALLAQGCRRAKASGEGLARLLKSCFLPLREYFKCFPQSPLPLHK